MLGDTGTLHMLISLIVLTFKNYRSHLFLSHHKEITHLQGPSRPVVTPPLSAVVTGSGYLDSFKECGSGLSCP